MPATTSNADLYEKPLDAALMYAEYGFRVAPVKPESKVPSITDWTNAATTDEATIRGWWEARPDHGVCIVTGRESGIWVLDVDVSEGKQGVETLQALLDEYNGGEKLPATLTARTPSGGLHFLFAYPDDCEIHNSASNRLGPGLDVRGEGGQINAVPTKRGEYSYRWANKRAPWSAAVLPAPSWLVDLVKDEEREAQTGELVPTGTKPETACDAKPRPVWDLRYCAEHTWEEMLPGDGWQLHSTDRNSDAHWTRPGKSQRDGSSATVYADSDKLQVFTTSLDWLPAGSYTRWAYMVHRDYRGDFSAAAAAYRPELSLVEMVQPAAQTSDAISRPTDDAAEHLPPEFWEARPELAHIRQAAHSRTESADVVLHAVLARTAGIVPYTLKLPATVGSPKPLSYFVGLVGPSGVGKSSGHDVAQELLPAPAYVLDGLPIGSGEGFAEALFGEVPEEDANGKVRMVKRQIHHNAISYVDEGEALGQLGKRSGSTLLSTLRSIWIGGTIGQTNASSDRKRAVPRGSYTFGFMIALQPEIAGDLLADSAVGTPQRFGWAWATDRTIPDEPVPWPGELDWTPPPRIEGQEFAVDPAIAAEIRAGKLAKTRGEKVADPAESHGPLMRLKIAGLLAVLAGRINIDTEDWALAEMVVKTSRAVRLKIEAVVAAEAVRREAHTAQTLARRQVVAASAVGDDLVERVAKKIAGLVTESGEAGLPAGAITQKLSRRQRDVEQEAVALCLEQAWIVRRTSPGQGRQKERFFGA